MSSYHRQISSQCIKAFDFISRAGFTPLPAESWGYDLVNFTGSVYSSSEDGSTTFWSLPGEMSFKPGRTFYRRVRLITQYYAFVGEIDDLPGGGTSGSIRTEGRTMTTVIQSYPFYYNPYDSMQAVLESSPTGPDGQLILTGAPYQNPTGPMNVTDPMANDFRVTGFPQGPDSTTEQYYSSTDGYPYSALRFTGYDYGVTTGVLMDQNRPPTITETSTTCYFEPVLPNHNQAYDGHECYIGSQTRSLEDAVPWETYLQQCQNLLTEVPLARGSFLATSEGGIYADFTGLSSIYPSLGNLVPTGAAYDGSGNATISGLPQNRILGIQVGPNDNGGVWQGYGGSYTDSPAAQRHVVGPSYFACQWYDGSVPTGYGHPPQSPPSTLTNPLFDTVISGGNSEITGAPTGKPDCATFDTENGSITLINGSPGAPVTAIVTPYSHCNQFIIFPLHSGVRVTCQEFGFAQSSDYQWLVAFFGPTGMLGLAASPGGWCAIDSMLQIPSNPLGVTADPTNFWRMYNWTIGNSSMTNLQIQGFSAINPDFTGVDLPVANYATLTTGIHYITSETVQSASGGVGYGFIYFGEVLTGENAQPAGAGSGTIGAGGGGTPQGAGGGQNSNL
jgi:hypothetical protein